MKRAILTATLVVLVAGLAGNFFRFSTVTPSRTAAFGEIPLAAGEYQGEEHFFDSASYDVLKADTSTLRLYHGSGGKGAWLFIAYFASQKYGSQIHSPKHCLPGSGWRIENLQPYDLKLPSGVTREVNRLVIVDGVSRQLMFYWFETRGGAIRQEFQLKWDLVTNSMLLRPTDAAIIRLTVPLDPSDTVDSATKRALDFFAVFYPSIERALPFSS
jgi:EpsI family protein